MSFLNFFFNFIQICGQDFVIDLCGAVDILRPIVLMMVRAQAVDLPPWKIPVWFNRLIRVLDTTEKELRFPEKFSNSSTNLQNLASNWEDITRYEDDDDEKEREGIFKGVYMLPGWMIVETTKKKTTENPDTIDDANVLSAEENDTDTECSDSGKNNL